MADTANSKRCKDTAASTRPEKVCDAASERALEASARLMEKFDETNRTLELLGKTTGVMEQGEYRIIKRALTARSDAFLEAANIVEFQFGVSRHPEYDEPVTPRSDFGI